MDGTCVKCPSVRTPDGEHLYSFFDDLVRVQKVNDLVAQTVDIAHTIGVEIKKYLTRYSFLAFFALSSLIYPKLQLRSIIMDTLKMKNHDNF